MWIYFNSVTSNKIWGIRKQISNAYSVYRMSLEQTWLTKVTMVEFVNEKKIFLLLLPLFDINNLLNMLFGSSLYFSSFKENS